MKGKIVDLYNSAGLGTNLTELDVLNDLSSVPQTHAAAPKSGRVSIPSSTVCQNDMTYLAVQNTMSVSVASGIVRDSVKVENSTSHYQSNVPPSRAPQAPKITNSPNGAVELNTVCSPVRLPSGSLIRIIPLSSSSLNAPSDGRFRPDNKVFGKIKQEPGSPTMRKRPKYDGGKACILLIGIVVIKTCVSVVVDRMCDVNAEHACQKHAPVT